MHHWGASVVVVMLLLHTLRVFFQGAYKKPRELNWMVGVLLFFVILGLGFTGYLLPWDNKAFFATQVGLEIAEQVRSEERRVGKVCKTRWVHEQATYKASHKY